MRSSNNVAKSQEASPEIGGRKSGLKGDQVASEEIVTFTDGGEHMQDTH